MRCGAVVYYICSERDVLILDTGRERVREIYNSYNPTTSNITTFTLDFLTELLSTCTGFFILLCPCFLLCAARVSLTHLFSLLTLLHHCGQPGSA